MKATQTTLGNLVILAQLLEKLERSPGTLDAAQYRSLVERTTHELAGADMDDAVEQLLKTSPAMAEVYENLHYAEAGLCRSPLDAATTAELRARELIARARHPA